MKTKRHDERYSRAIRALFLGQRPRSMQQDLSQHVKQCPLCKALVAQLSAADRLMAENLEVPAALSPFESALVWEGLRQQLRLPRPEPKAPRRLFWALGLASTALFLLAAFWLSLAGPASMTEEFQARGTMTPIQLELICIAQDESRRARAARQTDGQLSCRINESLGFTALVPEGPPMHLALFGLDATGQALWYTPDPNNTDSLRLEPGPRQQALPRTVRLAVNHSPGTTRVWALVSTDKLAFDRVRHLAQNIARGESLPDGISARQFTLEILGAQP